MSEELEPQEEEQLAQLADVGDPASGIYMPNAALLTFSRAARVPDPYNPDETVEDWEHAATWQAPGFIATNSRTTSQIEETVGRETSMATLTMPNPSAELKRGDHVTNIDGITYTVTETPAADQSPFTGWQPTRTATLEEWNS